MKEVVNLTDEKKRGPSVTEVMLKVEAVLFAGSRDFDVDELSRLCKENPKDIKKALKKLKKEYSERETAIVLTEEDGKYKFNVKDDYLIIVSNIVTETELSKSVMETLAVIAFKHPILQCDLIKIRTSKAYDHLKELEEAGYITREKFGRTKKIKLTQKFFEYFDLPPEKLKNAFSSYEAVEKAIEEKEHELAIANKEIVQMQKDAEEKARNASKIDLYGNNNNPPETPKIEVIEESSVAGLEVVDIEPSVPKQNIKISENKTKSENLEEVSDKGASETEGSDNHEEQMEDKAVQASEKRIEDIIDKKAEEMMHPADSTGNKSDADGSAEEEKEEKTELDKAYEDIEKAKDELFKKKDVQN